MCNIIRICLSQCTSGPDGSSETTSSRPQPTTGGRTLSNNHCSSETTHQSSIKSTSSPAYTSTPSISFAFNTSSTSFKTLSVSDISESSQATTSPLSLSELSESFRTTHKFSTPSPLTSSYSSTHFLFQHTLSSTGQPALSQTTTPHRASRGWVLKLS